MFNEQRVQIPIVQGFTQADAVSGVVTITRRKANNDLVRGRRLNFINTGGTPITLTINEIESTFQNKHVIPAGGTFNEVFPPFASFKVEGGTSYSASVGSHDIA